MYERVVVGTDGSDRAGTALEHAVELAKAFDAELHLVQGCGSPVMGMGFESGVAIDPSLFVEGAQERLDAMATPMRSDGIAVSVHAVAASGTAALCDVASEVNADVIVVGNRGMTGAARFLGSVPNAVAHNAPCSVLIVNTG